jgi:hypothetical protein
MNLRQHLITLIETYAEAEKLSPSRIGQKLFSSGSKYKQLVAGADITVGRLEEAVRWFDANWPDDLPWPADLPRPSLQAQADDTEAA